MKNLGVLVLIFSLIMAGVIAYGIYNVLNDSGEPAVVETTKVMMPFATMDIEQDSIINEDMVVMKEVSEGDYSIYHETMENVIGKYAISPILQGEMFHMAKVVEDNSNRLVAQFDVNYRAVSFQVTEYAAVGDLIKPGNRVDVYVYLPELTENNVVVRPDISKLVTQNAEVLAISQITSIEHEPRVEVPSTYSVTLTLHYTEVERLLLAENIGYLKLALRSYDDNEIEYTNGVIWQELLMNNNNLETASSGDESPSAEVVITPPAMDNNGDDPESETEDSESTDTTESNQSDSSSTPSVPVVEVPTTEDENFYYYTVKYGDTLMSIAREFYEGDHWQYVVIKDANGISDNNFIYTGQRLKIPKQ